MFSAPAVILSAIYPPTAMITIQKKQEPSKVSSGAPPHPALHWSWVPGGCDAWIEHLSFIILLLDPEPVSKIVLKCLLASPRSQSTPASVATPPPHHHHRRQLTAVLLISRAVSMRRRDTGAGCLERCALRCLVGFISINNGGAAELGKGSIHK